MRENKDSSLDHFLKMYDAIDLHNRKHFYYSAYSGLPPGLFSLKDGNFIKKFSKEMHPDLDSFEVIGVLWRRVRLGEKVDESTIIREFEEYMGKEKFSEQMRSHKEDFNEFVRRLEDLLCIYKKKFYAGLGGWFRSKTDEKDRKRLLAKLAKNHRENDMSGPLYKRMFSLVLFESYFRRVLISIISLLKYSL